MGACQGVNVVKNLEQNTLQLETEQLQNPQQNYNETNNQEEKLDTSKTQLQNTKQLEFKQVESEYIGSCVHVLQFKDMLSSNKNDSKRLDNNINSEKKMMTVKELQDESTQQITNPDLQTKNESPQKSQLNHDFINSNVRQLVQQQKQIQK